VSTNLLQCISPDADLDKVKSFYVIKLEKDGRGINNLIRDRLVEMGYIAKSGPEIPSAKYDADIVVDYEDRWRHDITMYMLKLTITLGRPDNGYPLAVGKSLHASLTRKSPEEMVEEVLAAIFDKAKSRKSHLEDKL